MPDGELGLIREGRERQLRARVPRRERLADCVLAATFVCVVGATMLAAEGPRLPGGSVAVAFTALYALASVVEFEVGSGLAVPTQLVFVPLMLTVPAPSIPIVAAVAFVLGDLGQAWRERRLPDPLRMLASSWYALGPALVLAAHDGPVGWTDGDTVALALIAQLALDYASGTVAELMAFGRWPSLLALRANAWVYLIDLMLTPVGLLIAPAVSARPWALVLTAPFMLLMALFARERTERMSAALDLSQAYRGAALLLGDVLEADDAYTASHSEGVLSLSLATADELRVDPRTRREVEFAALLHDIGKLKIPNELINKPGALDAAERTLIQTHTLEGQRLLAPFGGFLASIGGIVRACHERWDGGGYPDGLAGEAIPLAARIVFCADAYDAITSDRAYREGRSSDIALAEIAACSGTQFDPRVAAALCAAIQLGLQPSLFHAADGTPLYAPFHLSQTIPAMVIAFGEIDAGMRGISGVHNTFLKRPSRSSRSSTE